MIIVFQKISNEAQALTAQVIRMVNLFPNSRPSVSMVYQLHIYLNNFRHRTYLIVIMLDLHKLTK